ncbi:hypothetical protein [Streptomyces sp. NPDC058145]|uniref:hypothetical protein n=1 Tax=Streptomyces sp. NPDC058145 TaxID=3346356 RepID=UPI0036E0D8A0
MRGRRPRRALALSCTGATADRPPTRVSLRGVGLSGATPDPAGCVEDNRGIVGLDDGGRGVVGGKRTAAMTQGSLMATKGSEAGAAGGFQPGAPYQRSAASPTAATAAAVASVM